MGEASCDQTLRRSVNAACPEFRGDSQLSRAQARGWGRTRSEVRGPCQHHCGCRAEWGPGWEAVRPGRAGWRRWQEAISFGTHF